MAKKKQFDETVCHIGSEELGKVCKFEFGWHESDIEEDAKGVLHGKELIIPCVFRIGYPIGSGLEKWLDNDGLTVKFERYHVTETYDGEEQRSRVREVEFQNVLFYAGLPEDSNGYFWMKGITNTPPNYTVVKD